MYAPKLRDVDTPNSGSLKLRNVRLSSVTPPSSLRRLSVVFPGLVMMFSSFRWYTVSGGQKNVIIATGVPGGDQAGLLRDGL